MQYLYYIYLIGKNRLGQTFPKYFFSLLKIIIGLQHLKSKKLFAPMDLYSLGSLNKKIMYSVSSNIHFFHLFLHI